MDINAEVDRIESLNGHEQTNALVALLQSLPARERPAAMNALRYVVIEGGLVHPNADGNATLYVNGKPVVDTLGYELLDALPAGVTREQVDAIVASGNESAMRDVQGLLMRHPSQDARDLAREVDIALYGRE